MAWRTRGTRISIQVAMAMKLSAGGKRGSHERTMRILAAAMANAGSSPSRGSGEQVQCSQAKADSSKMQWRTGKPDKRKHKIPPNLDGRAAKTLANSSLAFSPP